MISYIKGNIADISENLVVVENNGIGFNILTPMSVVGSGIRVGDKVKLYTYFQVREDAMQLFGFLTKDDLKLFKLLLTVNSIGPKNALSIMSGLTPENIKLAIISGDAKAIAKAPGVGKKTAEKVILELKDKFSADDIFEGITGEDGANAVENINAGDSQIKNEAVEVLVALGYGMSESLKAVNSVKISDTIESGEVVKAALKQLF